MVSGKQILEKLTDPSVKWYVYPSINFQKRIYGNITTTNQTLYLCDDALCFPIRFSGYLSWYDPSTGNVGSRVFPNHGEAWDHTNESNPNTAAPYNGAVYWVAGYRGYWVGVHLTDGTSRVQVNILHRYTDGAILIFNTGKDGTTSVNITVRVNDPPSGLGYSKQTNGTTGTGYTDIAPGQYVLFYKGTTPPSIDTTNGVFSTSPLGSAKSLSYELYVNAFTVSNINVPKMYLGIASRVDKEIVSNFSFFATFNNQFEPSGAFRGGSCLRTPINCSGYFSYLTGLIMSIYDSDSYASATTWAGGWSKWQVWFGWGEVDGTVKYLLWSYYDTKHTTKWEQRARVYYAVLYDFDEDVEYYIGIAKPLTNIYCYGEGGAVINPALENMGNYYTNASALLLLNSDDTTTKITTAATTTWTHHDNIYGFCNYYSDKIVCTEGVAIYTDDTNLAITNPKSAWGCSRGANWVGARGIRIPPWGDKTWTAGKLYIAIARQKQFPSTTSDTDLANWMKSIQPVVLSSTDVNGILSKPPFSLWLFGGNTSTMNITVPTQANPGQTITVSVTVDTIYANKTAWALLLDSNNNVLATGSGTVASDGTCNISLTIPSTLTPGTYRVRIIVAGDRTLP